MSLLKSLRKFLTLNKQFIIACLVFSVFGTGVTFALPYFPSDAQLDPSCAPGDADCYVQILPDLTSGSIIFSDGTTLLEDNTNFFWDDTNNRLGIGDNTPLAMFTVGSGDLFQINSSGAIAVAAGITSSGNINFSDFTLNSVPFFGNSGLLSQDNTNFTFDDSTNLLYAKYMQTDSTIYQNSSFLKAANQTANNYLSIFLGRSIGAGAAAQTSTSTPSSGINDYGGIAIGQSILSTTTTATAFTQSILLGSEIYDDTNQTDGSLLIAIGTNIGGTGYQNQSVLIGQDIMALSTAAHGYNGSSGHKNVAIGRQSMYRVNGGWNTAVGVLSLARLTTGSNNVAIGTGAGNGSATSAQSGLTGSSLTFLGAGSTWTVDAISNATAVGAGASLAQSNTVILGNNADVGIGTSTPGYKLDVNNNTASSYTARFFNDGNDDNRYGILIQSGADTPSAGRWVQFNDGDGGDIGTVSLVTGTLTLTTTSDERLKQNIVDTNIGLNNLMNIRVRDFSYIRDPGTQVHGFIAQELKEVYPDAVIVPSNPEDYWKVSYSQLTPLIVKSIQDLNIEFSEFTKLDFSSENTLASKIKIFLSNAGNTLQEIYTSILYADRVKTHELCVGEVCVTESEFLNIVQSKSQSIAETPAVVEPTVGEDDALIDEPESTEDTENSEENSPVEIPTDGSEIEL